MSQLSPSSPCGLFAGVVPLVMLSWRPEREPVADIIVSLLGWCVQVRIPASWFSLGLDGCGLYRRRLEYLELPLAASRKRLNDNIIFGFNFWLDNYIP